jgi:hypothetical protein
LLVDVMPKPATRMELQRVHLCRIKRRRLPADMKACRGQWQAIPF